MKYKSIPLWTVLNDHRDTHCEICHVKVNPIYRFCYELSDEDQSSVADCEIQICKDCADKHCKGWKKYLNKD